ncbi:3-mercaptopyruvate sulfurtransferase [Maritalea sp.]|uniref:3-mercaptopyruvate sulfurtransferase n=1 Tax=Maritalea sp. TaxID=2003361 RepID=UPI003EFA2041
MLNQQLLISADQLHREMGSNDLVIVDGSWHLPNANRDARAEYESGHISGAQFFNIDTIADQNSGLPHTMPSPETFALAVGAMGISNNSNIVVYDATGMFSAARVWLMFKLFGAQNVRVLNGGLPAWKSAGFAVTDKKRAADPAQFIPEFDASSVVLVDEMRKTVDAGSAQVLDARGAGRFAGTDPEPREGMRAGHMPGATNVPFSSLLNEDGTFKSSDELKTMFADKHIDLGKPITTTCGSGVTASIILLALELIGKTDARLYDGSWAEWGSLSDTPIEKT